MCTLSQQLANNENAQHSTRPRTAEGKAVSSRNGLQHGLSSGFAVLPCEDPSEFDALTETLADEFRPTSAHQTYLVGQMAQSRWRMARIQGIETEVFSLMLDDTAEPITPYGRIAANLAPKDPTAALSLLQCYAAALGNLALRL